MLPEYIYVQISSDDDGRTSTSNHSCYATEYAGIERLKINKLGFTTTLLLDFIIYYNTLTN